MNMIFFIIAALVLIGISVGVILRALLKVDKNKSDYSEKQREAENIRHLKQQLADLDMKLANKDITQENYAQYKLDAERRALASVSEISTTENKTPVATLISIFLTLPIATALIYLAIGEPNAITDKAETVAKQAQQNQAPQTIEGALAAVQERLRRDPNDVEAKFSLGSIYYADNKFVQARDVFKDLFNQLPDRPDVLIAYAEAQARTQNNFFKGLPLELVERVLQLDPKHKKANWLLGIAAFQEDDKESALNIWQQQLARTDNTDDERMMLERMIVQAGGELPKTQAHKDEPAHLTITASISDKLRGMYKPDDSVFIYAKAASGPAMPLAIYRTTADKLPLTLTLTDADAMTPQMTLSMFKQIIAIARISKSGDAITQSGDLQGQSPVLSGKNIKLSIEIDSVIP